ncbi:MAG: efflux RND transporter permease subunit [Candidatus Omnitrophica bacterium]|nr:efflux RND transporter permease subunit [Candidatus Omnitrophota bacterium]MDD5610658.1 efflux RND transporter permease subunit [Candidatus Omnitrophota bacterium]
MNFTEIFIRKPIMTTLIMVVVLIFGVAAFMKLPVSDLPVVDSPVITVTVAYPGASPNMMASTVAQPLENQFTQIQGLQSMISTNTEGQTQILLTFDLDRNVDLAAPDVQAAITQALANLPTDLPAPPIYQKTNPSDMPIMYLLVTSDTLTPGQLYDYANKSIAQRISMIDGVSQALVWGAKTAVRVQANPNKLAAYQIDVNEIAAAVTTGTVTIPGGSLNGPVRAFSIEPQGQLLKAKDYKELIVAYRNNAPVRLKDVATCVDSIDNDVVNVMFGYAKQKMQSHVCVIPISRAAGVNTVALADNIKSTIEELKKEIPGSVKLDIFYDKSETIIESINDVKTTILIAIILVVLVIFFFLGRLSDTIIPSVALPMSIIATFLVMAALGFTLDNLSLMGIILAVGFVVDDAIVVLENTVRLIEKGMKPLEAAIKSASEIGFTIISMTLSLAVIFIPLVFMAGIVGRSFREFAITVVATILCSGVVSLMLSPMMCARMLKERRKENKFEKSVTDFLKGVIDKYGALLKLCLHHKFSMVVIWTACLIGTMVLFMILPQTFLPEGDSGAIRGGLLMPLGVSTKQAQKYQYQVNNILSNDPNVQKIITATGLQPGADQSTGVFVVKLKPKGKRLEMAREVLNLRRNFAKLPGGFAFVQAIPTLRLSTGGEATATGSKYSYTMSGPQQDELYKAALKLEQNMRKLPGFVDIQNSVKLNLPQLTVDILRDRASTLGITAQDIESALAKSYAQGKITTYKTEIDQYNVIVELDKRYQDWPEELSQVYLHSRTTNGLVPLLSIAKIRQTVGPQNVPHFNQLPSATLSFNLAPNVPLGNATKALENAADPLLPPGAVGVMQGEAQQFQQAVASLGILIIIAIFIKYVILGILYESYTHPMTIITTLPVATFGGLLTLLLFGSQLSLYAYVGIFMLLGIVAKNGIMMVDFAKVNMDQGKSAYDAIYDACLVRFRPILMTGLAAIMGAMPLALGYGADGESRMPLGLIVVGGMVFSQVITLFVTPAIFLYMQDFQEKFLDRFELTRSDAARKSEKVE